MTDEKMDELFQQYKLTRDVAIRNKIAEKYLYIADIIAKKFVGRGVEYDDLKQVASYALVRGIERFDVDLGMQFTTFITPTITGEIKNYFRDKSRVIKVPRRLGELNLAVRKFASEYEAKNGEKPSVATIATALKQTQEEVVRAMEIGMTTSLDGFATDSEKDGEQSLYSVLADDEDKYEAFEIKESLLSAMRDFSDAEKKLIKYRYDEQLSQSEVAKRLGVTQMFVSRTERKLLARLRERLQTND
jgi:RNA polymerase sigma-B factor